MSGPLVVYFGGHAVVHNFPVAHLPALALEIQILGRHPSVGFVVYGFDVCPVRCIQIQRAPQHEFARRSSHESGLF